MPPLLTYVATALAQAGLLDPPGQAIVAAVSGGPDSLALLYLLHSLQEKRPFKLHAAHVNHGLRGAESDEDAHFIEMVCQKLGVPLSTERVDIKALRSEHRLSLEAAAREARYTFLAHVASEVWASAVVTGHTADDQAETVLLHLLRGSGIRGLRGMLPVSRWYSRNGAYQAALVRPLLQATRQETVAYCTNLGLSPRYDASNAEVRFTRNRIRHSLLPQLEQYNPAISDALTRLAQSVAKDVAYLDEQVQTLWPSLTEAMEGGLQIRRRAFLGLHPSLQAHLIQRAHAELAGEAADLSFSQIEGMLRLARQGAGKELNLGHDLKFLTGYDHLLIATEPSSPLWPSLREWPLQAPGEIRAQGWRIQVRRLRPDGMSQDAIGSDPYRAYLDADATDDKLWVRSRAPGDRFQPLGMNTPKKLKEFMIDAHIPRHERDGVPLLVSQRGIAWVVGYRIAHWARVTPEAQSALEVTFAREG